MAEHFIRGLVRLAVNPEPDQQAGDQGRVDLNCDAVGTGEQQVPAS